MILKVSSKVHSFADKGGEATPLYGDRVTKSREVGDRSRLPGALAMDSLSDTGMSPQLDPDRVADCLSEGDWDHGQLVNAEEVFWIGRVQRQIVGNGDCGDHGVV